MAEVPTLQTLEASKHNPDFGGRNLQRKHELQTILSNLQIKLELDYQASDQVAFDDLYKRLQTAYDGLKVVKPEPIKSPADMAHEKRWRDIWKTLAECRE